MDLGIPGSALVSAGTVALAEIGDKTQLLALLLAARLRRPFAIVCGILIATLLNHALADGPVSLSDAVAMLDTAYLGHVIVLWTWALKQPDSDGAAESVTVRFRSLDGRDREIAVPHLTFTEPITSLAGASA